jgi:hypothetical protein
VSDGDERGDVGTDLAPVDRWRVNVVRVEQGVDDTGEALPDGLWPTLTLYFQGTEDSMTFLMGAGTALGIVRDLVEAVGVIDHPDLFGPDGGDGEGG